MVKEERSMNLFEEGAVKSKSFGSIVLRRKNRAYCPLCGKLIRLVAVAEAADFFRSDREEVERLAVAGELHRIHNRAGKVMICGESLFKGFEERQTKRLSVDLLPRLTGPA
jgi:hypothetical protein